MNHTVQFAAETKKMLRINKEFSQNLESDSTNQSFNESPLKPIGNNNKSTHSKMIEDTMVKIVNIGMMNNDGVVSGSVTSTAASSTKDSAAIKTEEHHRHSSSFCNKTSLSKRTIATQSSSKSSFQLHNTSNKCNSNKKRSSETFKLQIKEAINKLHDLGRRKSRSEDKKKKKKMKKKNQLSKDSNSKNYELMIAELEKENRQRGQR